MFRENVLIALTLLVTILSLSYIILLTVYMQLSDMERRIKAENKSIYDHQHQEKMFEAEDAYFKLMAYQQMTIDNERKMADAAAVANEKYDRNILEQYGHRNENDFSNNVNAGCFQQLFMGLSRQLNQYPSPPELSYSDFGFRDDKHPQNVIKFPYKFYGNNGHITIKVPDSQTHMNVSANLAHESLLTEILRKIEKFITESTKDAKREFRSASVDSSPEEGHIWFKPKTLEEIAGKVGAKARNQNGNNLLRNEMDGYGNIENANEMDQDENENSILW